MPAPPSVAGGQVLEEQGWSGEVGLRSSVKSPGIPQPCCTLGFLAPVGGPQGRRRPGFLSTRHLIRLLLRETGSREETSHRVTETSLSKLLSSRAAHSAPDGRSGCRVLLAGPWAGALWGRASDGARKMLPRPAHTQGSDGFGSCPVCVSSRQLLPKPR